MWCRVPLLRTDISEERVASIVRVERIRELETLAVTSKLDNIAKTLTVLLVVRFQVITPVTMKKAVFWDRETRFVSQRRQITSPLQSPVG
jgi:hypothetical protein